MSSKRPLLEWLLDKVVQLFFLVIVRVSMWCSYVFFVIGKVSMSSFFLYHCSSHPGFRHGIEDGAGGGEGQLDRLQEPFVCRGAQPPGQEVGCTV